MNLIAIITMRIEKTKLLNVFIRNIEKLSFNTHIDHKNKSVIN